MSQEKEWGAPFLTAGAFGSLLWSRCEDVCELRVTLLKFLTPLLFFFCLLSPSVVCTTSSHTVTLQRVSSFGQLYENVKTRRRWGEVQRKTSHLPQKRICNSAASSPNYMGLCWSLHKTRAKRERQRQNVRKGEERRVRRQAGGGLPHFVNTEFTSQSCSELMLTKQRHSCSF